jgi:microcystin-dependent protein
MASPFVGQLMTVPYNFAPRDWATCQGQTLSIQQNTTLFALLGTTYGGNGQTTFQLPDLRGRAAMGWGQGPGTSNYILGQTGGTENTTLNTTNLPAHTHVIVPTTVNAVNVKATLQAPQAGAFVGRAIDGAPSPNMIPKFYVPASGAAGQPQLALGGVNSAGTTGVAGSNNPFSTMQPYLTLTQIIALFGVFPSRN